MGHAPCFPSFASSGSPAAFSARRYFALQGEIKALLSPACVLFISTQQTQGCRGWVPPPVPAASPPAASSDRREQIPWVQQKPEELPHVGVLFVQPWNRLPRGVAEASSLKVDVVLRDVG